MADAGGSPDASPPPACGTYWSLYVADPEVEDSYELFARRFADGPVDGPFQLNEDLFDLDRVRDGSRVPFAWSPVAQRVAFVIERNNAGREIWAADLAGPTPTAPSRVSGVPVEGGGVLPYSESASISWSPDGTKIAYIADQSVDGVFELWVVDMSGSEPGVAQRVNAPPTSTDMHVTAAGPSFRWSFDSTRIIYRANHNDVDAYEIFMVDVSGANPSEPIEINAPLLEGTDVEDEFAWTADGSGVIYQASASSPSDLRAYLARLSGGEVAERVELTPAGPNGPPVMAPSGDAFVYYVHDDGIYLVELEPSPSQPQRISGSGTLGTPEIAWSPDSTEIGFLGKFAGDPEGVGRSLYVAHRASGAGEEPTRVSGELADGDFIQDFSWTSDSEGLVYRGTQAGGDNWGDLFFADLNEGSAIPLFETNGGVRIKRYRPSPGGALAAFLTNDADNVIELYAVKLGPQSPTPFKVNGELTPAFPEPQGDVGEFAWSPEARSILYSADQDVDNRTEAYVTPIDGAGAGTPVKLNGGFDVDGQVWDIGWGPCAE